MSARVCTPPVLTSSPMDLGRGASERLLSSTAESRGQSSLPASAATPADSRYFFGSGSGLSSTRDPCRPNLSTSDPLLNMSRLRGVSRNLFGAPHPSSAQYARDKVKELLAMDSKRWNFDFEKLEPLPGRYQWERVGRASPTPSKSKSLDSIPASTRVFPTVPILSLAATPIPSTSARVPYRREFEPLFIVRPVPRSVVCNTNESEKSSPPNLPTSSSKEVPVSSPASPPEPTSVVTPPPLAPFPIFTKSISSSGNLPSVASNILVRSSVEPSEDESKVRKFLRKDSSSKSKSKTRQMPKQPQITSMYLPVKKRRVGSTPGSKKKASF